ncbi:phage tail tape measure protein [Leptobacterium sp. I13]|uniref:phage tail tape measure protein n=1 Tax=Leptobacterium meishanense TaxID=3128904 RepID=UPI0030EC6B47
MANKKITRQLSIFINGKEVKNSLGGIGREIAKVKAKLKEANDPTDIKKYKGELDGLRKKYGKVKEEIHGTNEVLKEARGHWDNLSSGFLSGNLKQVQAGLKGIAGNIKGITKAALAFIATPFGAALAIVAAVGFGVKKWIDYNIEIEKTNQLIRDLTQETGRAVDIIRIRAEVLQKTFEVDINQSVESAKSLVKSFGISYNEAFDIIEDGAIRGKLKNNEYLDSLKEYPVQFRNAGFSAQDFANIVGTGIDLSIYSDKLPDAIKEFNLAITEQTDAARDALINAFGEKFTKKLLRDLRTGAVTTKDALALISAEAERIGLNSQQAQLLTADLFKGAGEDAGGALKIFEAVNIALNKQKKPLTEIQQIQKEQLATNKELNSLYTQLFSSGSKGFNLWIQRGKLFATQTLIKILKGGVDLYNWIVELNNESRTFSAVLATIGKIVFAQFEIIILAIENAGMSFRGLGDIIEGVFTLDSEKVKQGFVKTTAATLGFFNDVKNKALSDFKDIQDAWNGNNKLEKVSLDDFLTTDDTNTTADDLFSNTDNSNSELTQEDKRIIESKKKLAEFLDQWEADRKLQKELEKLEESQRAEEEEVLKLEAKFAKMEEEAGLTAVKEEELAEADRELKARLEEAKEQEIAAIRKKYTDKRLVEKKKADKAFEKELKKHHKRLADAEFQLEEAKKNALVFGIQTLKSVFGEKTAIYKGLFALEKALAVSDVITNASKSLAQITANTAIANAKAVAASPLTGGQPFVGINTAIATKQALATKINAGIQIASILATSIKGFKQGGHTGNVPIYHDGQGAVTGVVHTDEWVAPKFMTESPRYAPVINWLEKERLKALGRGFKDGGHVDSSSITVDEKAETPFESNTTNTLLIDMIQDLKTTLAAGIRAYSVRDYEEFLRHREIDEEHQQILNNTRS